MNTNQEQLHRLIDLYFEGLTSLEEEQRLRDYFTSSDVDPDFRLYQPMFQYFEEERGAQAEPDRGRPETQRRGLIIRRMGLVAAACAAVLIAVGVWVYQAPVKEKSYAYVDGKRYTNIEVLQTQALGSLESLSEDDEEVFSSQIEMLDNLFE